MAKRRWGIKFLLIIIILAALGGYFTWEAQKDKLQLPYRLVPQSTAALTDPGDILFIGDQNVNAWAAAENILQKKVSQGLKNPLKMAFKALEVSGIHRVTAYLAELLTPASGQPRWRKPQIVVYVLGNHELQECKMRPAMLPAIKHQFYLENNPRWSTLLALLPFLRPWLIDLGEPVVLGELTPWPAIDEITELTYRELAAPLFQKELAILANFLKKQQIKLVVVTAPLNLTTVSEVWPSSTSVTLQKLLQEIDQQIKANQIRPAAQALEPLKKFPGNARTWFYAGKIAWAQGDFSGSMRDLKMAKSFSAERDEALPVYNVLAKQAGQALNFTVFDLASDAEKYLWAQGELDLAGYPASSYYQSMAPLLGELLGRLLF